MSLFEQAVQVSAEAAHLRDWAAQADNPDPADRQAVLDRADALDREAAGLYRASGRTD